MQILELKNWSTPSIMEFTKLTPEQVEVVEDMKAFLEFALNNNVSYWQIIGTLNHDTRGLINEEPAFLPRTSGYSKK